MYPETFKATDGRLDIDGFGYFFPPVCDGDVASLFLERCEGHAEITPAVGEALHAAGVRGTVDVFLVFRRGADVTATRALGSVEVAS